MIDRDIVEELVGPPPPTPPSGELNANDAVNFVGESRNGPTGIIEGMRDAIRFGDGDHSRATIVNEQFGLITAVSRAVDPDGQGLKILNEGVIRTIGDARNGMIYATASATGYRIEDGENGVIEGDLSRS